MLENVSAGWLSLWANLVKTFQIKMPFEVVTNIDFTSGCAV